MSVGAAGGECRARLADGGTPARAALCGFALLTLVHLGSLLMDLKWVEYATKPALMPVLAGYVVLRRGPRLLSVALLFGSGGDTLLQVGGEAAFLAGMGSFAAGHLCYLALFARVGRGRARRRTVALLITGYAAAWWVTVAVLWPGLETGLRGPVAGYSLLLTAMALAALRVGPWAGFGGALFLLSDTLIATGLADWPQLPVPQFWIMLTYVGAQLALTTAVLVGYQLSRRRRGRWMRRCGGMRWSLMTGV